MPRLAPDQAVPALAVPLAGGGEFALANEQPRNFTMLVFYRGLHCPVCKGYLQGLQNLLSGYDEAGVSVAAVSMNDQATAEKTRAVWGLSKLRLGYTLPEGMARQWGLYISNAIKDAEAKRFCEPGLFLVRPDGRLYLASVSNMPWGRPNLEELLAKIAFAVEKQYPARGVVA